MENQRENRIWTKSFISLALTQFLVFTVFYTLLTTLPLFVIHNLSETQTKAGLVFSYMLISAILIRPFSAKIIDTFGHKRVLVLGVLAYTLTTVAYIFVGNFFVLSMVRIVHGISFAIVSTVTGTIAANILPKSRRGEGLGYFALSMNIAVVIGPFIGLILIQYVSFYHLFTILSILMFVSTVCSLLVNTREIVTQDSEITSLKMSDLIEVKVLPVSTIGALVGFSYGSILSFIPIYADELGLSELASYFFLVFAIVMIIFRPYVGRAFDQKGPKFVMLPSILIFAIGLALLSVTSTASLFLIAAGLVGLGYGTLLPGFQAMSVQISGLERSSQAISTFFTMFDIGVALGAFILGLISANFSFEIMYFLSALLLVFTAIAFHYQLKTRYESN